MSKGTCLAQMTPDNIMSSEAETGGDSKLKHCDETAELDNKDYKKTTVLPTDLDRALIINESHQEIPFITDKEKNVLSIDGSRDEDKLHQSLTSNNADIIDNDNNKTNDVRPAGTGAKPKFKEKRPVPLKLNKTSITSGGRARNQDTPLDLSTKTPGSCLVSNSSIFAAHQQQLNNFNVNPLDGQTLASLPSSGALETPRIIWQEPYEMVLNKMRLYSASSGSSSQNANYARSLHHSTSSFNLGTEPLPTPLTPVTPNTPAARSSIMSMCGLDSTSPLADTTISGKTEPLSAGPYSDRSKSGSMTFHLSPDIHSQLNPFSIGQQQHRMSSLGACAQNQDLNNTNNRLTNNKNLSGNLFSPLSSMTANIDEYPAEWFGNSFGNTPIRGHSLPRRSCSSDNLISILNSPLFQHQIQKHAMEFQELSPCLLPTNLNDNMNGSQQQINGLINRMLSVYDLRSDTICADNGRNANNNGHQNQQSASINSISNHLSPHILTNLARSGSAAAQAAVAACQSASASSVNQRFLYPSCKNHLASSKNQQHTGVDQSNQRLSPKSVVTTAGAAAASATANMLSNIHIYSPTNSNHSGSSPKNSPTFATATTPSGNPISSNQRPPTNRVNLPTCSAQKNSDNSNNNWFIGKSEIPKIPPLTVITNTQRSPCSGGHQRSSSSISSGNVPLATQLSNNSGTLHTPKLLSPMFTNMVGIPTPPSASAFDIWGHEFRFPATNLGEQQHFASSDQLFSPLLVSKISPIPTTPKSHNRHAQQKFEQPQTTTATLPIARPNNVNAKKDSPIESFCVGCDPDLNKINYIDPDGSTAAASGFQMMNDHRNDNGVQEVVMRSLSDDLGNGHHIHVDNNNKASIDTKDPPIPADLSPLITSFRDKSVVTTSVQSSKNSPIIAYSQPVSPMDVELDFADESIINQATTSDCQSDKWCNEKCKSGTMARIDADSSGRRSTGWQQDQLIAKSIPKIYVSSDNQKCESQDCCTTTANYEKQLRNSFGCSSINSATTELSEINDKPSSNRISGIYTQELTQIPINPDDLQLDRKHANRELERNQSCSAPPHFLESGRYGPVVMDQAGADQRKIVQITGLENSTGNRDVNTHSNSCKAVASSLTSTPTPMNHDPQLKATFSLSPINGFDQSGLNSAYPSQCSSRLSNCQTTTTSISPAISSISNGSHYSTPFAEPPIGGYVGFRSNSAEPLGTGSCMAGGLVNGLGRQNQKIGDNNLGELRSHSSCEVEQQLRQHQKSVCLDTQYLNTQSVQHLPETVNHQQRQQKQNNLVNLNNQVVTNDDNNNDNRYLYANSTNNLPMMHQCSGGGFGYMGSQPNLQRNQCAVPPVTVKGAGNAYHATQNNTNSEHMPTSTRISSHLTASASGSLNLINDSYSGQTMPPTMATPATSQIQQPEQSSLQLNNRLANPITSYHCKSSDTVPFAIVQSDMVNMSQQQSCSTFPNGTPQTCHPLVNLENNSSLDLPNNQRQHQVGNQFPSSIKQAASGESSEVARSSSVDRWPRHFTSTEHTGNAQQYLHLSGNPCCESYTNNRSNGQQANEQSEVRLPIAGQSSLSSDRNDSTQATSMASCCDSMSPYSSSRNSSSANDCHQAVTSLLPTSNNNLLQLNTPTSNPTKPINDHSRNHQLSINMKARRSTTRADRSQQQRHQCDNQQQQQQPNDMIASLSSLANLVGLNRPTASTVGPSDVVGTVIGKDSSSEAQKTAGNQNKNHPHHHHARRYHCDSCQKSFTRSDMLTRHRRLHSGDKPFGCAHCNQTFSRSDHLQTHMRTHTGQKPYKCNFCKYTACRKDMITRHMRTHNRIGA